VNQPVQWVLLNGDQVVASNSSVSVCSVFSLQSNSSVLFLIRDRSDLPTTPSQPVQTDSPPPHAIMNVQVFNVPSLPSSIPPPTPVY
jgi:hypothetical protein